MRTTIVFDIGNVLIRYAPGPAFEAFVRRYERSRWRVRWVMARAGIRLLSTGEKDPEAFLRDINRGLGLDVAHEDFRDLWGLDLPEPVEGMLELLDAVRRRAPTALLSDTNPFHWEFLVRAYPVLAEIEPAFLSFREGLMKPDRRFFETAERRLRAMEGVANNGAKADGESRHLDAATKDSPGRQNGGDILFFDDLPPNVEGARAAGWDAHRFIDRATTERLLREQGIL